MSKYNDDMIGALTYLGFLVGIANYGENLTQNDKSDLEDDLSEKADRILAEIHSHLKVQDRKIDRLMEMVERYGSKRNLQQCQMPYD